MLKPNLTVFWLIVFAVSAIIEISTTTFFAIWFGVSAIVTLILNLIDVPLNIQIAVFILLTTALILSSEFILKKRFHILGKPYRSNVNAIIGKTGVVTKEIDGISYKGEVLLDGRYWSAISADGSTIPAGTKVEVINIEGVKLIVKKKE